ncbi:MAG TPA: DUF4258 domain-containing protein [Candidatus Acidoferrales bacterium]|nr:DUF4258 domain-containing protein [Candidatus Acidoferrales bacterium]
MAHRLVFRVQALQRMSDRQITVEDVERALATGEVIEAYPDDHPYPSCLMLGWRGSRPLHVVIAENAEDNEAIVITAYEPDPARWDVTFKRRTS